MRHKEVDVYLFKMMSFYIRAMGYKEDPQDRGYFLKGDNWIKLNPNNMWSITYKREGKVTIIPINSRDSYDTIMKMFKKEIINDKN